MENNPYQTPESQLLSESYSDSELASRWQRFWAAMIDMVIGIVASVPLWMSVGFDKIIEASQSFDLGVIALSLVYGLVVFMLLHGYFLHKNGQTIGKKVIGIRIADMNNDVPPLSKLFFFRVLPVTFMAFIPVIGGFLSLIDILFIYRNDKRCVHDLIASTQVLKV